MSNDPLSLPLGTVKDLMEWLQPEAIQDIDEVGPVPGPRHFDLNGRIVTLGSGVTHYVKTATKAAAITKDVYDKLLPMLPK